MPLSAFCKSLIEKERQSKGKPVIPRTSSPDAEHENTANCLGYFGVNDHQAGSSTRRVGRTPANVASANRTVVTRPVFDTLGATNWNSATGAPNLNTATMNASASSRQSSSPGTDSDPDNEDSDPDNEHLWTVLKMSGYAGRGRGRRPTVEFD